ncbi:MAG: ParA family protein [Candidatus Electrothrix communis]|nr:MAG: ParA family protein [Candidatus Electrothrix communis]
MTARVIAFANRKGGSGKTTSATNCAHGLSKKGTVLFIDMDAQAHASTILTAGNVQCTVTVTDVLRKESSIEKAIYKSRLPGLSILPSSRDLGSYELESGVDPKSAVALADLLSPLLTQYDYIILDPPPTLGGLMITSLAAANEVYIPMQFHFLAMEGLAEMMRVIYRLNAEINPALHLAGIIPTFFNRQFKTSRKIYREIATNFGDNMILPAIRNNIKLAEAPAYGQTIFEHSPGSIGAIDYKKLVEAIV